MIKKMVSGGQTGADQAALDTAIEMNIPHGGWIPKGRITENGILSKKYNLKEMPTDDYSKRTEQNILDSEGTLILSHGILTGGSALTREFAIKHKRPYLHIDINTTSQDNIADKIILWLKKNNITILNVAGPRASKDPYIYKSTMDILKKVYYFM